MVKFSEYVGGGYWVRHEGQYEAVIKIAYDGWYGGATEYGATSVPLHGPYRLKRTAKKKAVSQLVALISEDEQRDYEGPEFNTGGSRDR